MEKRHFTNLGPLGPQWAMGPKISDVMAFGSRISPTLQICKIIKIPLYL